MSDQGKVYLLLENGTLFYGKGFGAYQETTGELVFTTGMTGYLETLTDPSYYGQIVLQTFPLIGNYGVISEDFESKSPLLSAYIVREWCEAPSNFRNEGNLDSFLKKNNIVGISGIDTRKLTKMIREAGVMNAKILTALPEDLTPYLKELSSFQIQNAVASVSSKEKSTISPEIVQRHIALWDFGAKKNILRELLKRNCKVTIFPSSSRAEEILSEYPDGLMLSNGPGDPAENEGIIRELRILCEARIPTFGICLGHQLLALANGGKTQKLPYGHRGANQPVKDLFTQRVYITSQNHGYAVLENSLKGIAAESFQNANDHTNEGLVYERIPAFSVQFHPEACPGSKDTVFLFDNFMRLVDETKRGRN